MISAIDRVKASSALTLINQRLGFRFRDTEREEGERERGRLSSPLSLGYNATVVGTVNSFADLTVFLFVRLDADLVSLSLSVPYRDLSTHCYEFRETEKRYERCPDLVVWSAPALPKMVGIKEYIYKYMDGVSPAPLLPLTGWTLIKIILDTLKKGGGKKKWS